MLCQKLNYPPSFDASWLLCKRCLTFIPLVTYSQTDNYFHVAIILRNVIFEAFVLRPPSYAAKAEVYVWCHNFYLLTTILVIFSDSCDF